MRLKSRKITAMVIAAVILAVCLVSAGAAGLSAEERSDYEEYGLEIWSKGGRLPVNLGKPMEQFLEEHYIPTVVIEDRS